ncbi:hypothetical protein [Caulobacter sp. NIBR1757]|uniref:hypothetical protein n=1 Tax=Caulobacter sp. NIBR1757 TaxID=3016000 RepID=UPI0022F04EAA|nr:hypothetical protein [Caulobacter sp. NIBR1757]WGM38738.1 hypothetical protein AMEJIAPC_01643 [Caulobacter sp. NIBR1757]
MNLGEVIGFSIVVLVAVFPLVAVSVIAHRSRRRGWWVAAPWLALAAMSGLGLQLMYSGGQLRAGADVTVAVLLVGLISAWLSLTIILAALTIVGPKLPPPGIIDRR